MSRLSLIIIASVVIGTVASPADPPPPISNESYRRTADADIAVLQGTLKSIAAEPDKLKGRITSSKGVAMLLVRYADAMGDSALKAQAHKVSQKLDAKDWKAAAELGKGLAAPKADPTALKGPLPKLTHAETFARSDRRGLAA